MVRNGMLTVVLAGLFAVTVLAGETVGVSGSDARFATTMELKIKGQPVRLVLTGTALRKKYLFNVYAIGGYVQEGAGVRSADELAAADTPKVLHLVMDRDLDGATMAAAFREAVRLNYPPGTFDKELDTLTAFVQATAVKKGEHVWLTHLPGMGLHVRMSGDKAILIQNPAFSKAIWDVYLGPNNLGEPIKRGLTSRL